MNNKGASIAGVPFSIVKVYVFEARIVCSACVDRLLYSALQAILGLILLCLKGLCRIDTCLPYYMESKKYKKNSTLLIKWGSFMEIYNGNYYVYIHTNKINGKM